MKKNNKKSELSVNWLDGKNNAIPKKLSRNKLLIEISDLINSTKTVSKKLMIIDTLMTRNYELNKKEMSSVHNFSFYVICRKVK